MAESFNERILDAEIRHAIGLLRFREGAVDRVVAQLERVERDLAKQLRERLLRIEERGFDLGPRTTQRLRTLQATVREILHQGYLDAGDQLRAELFGIANEEVDFQTRLIQSNTPFVDLQFNIPPTPAIRSIVTATPIRGELLTPLIRRAERNSIQRVNEAVRIGIIEGETTPQIVRRALANEGALGISKRGMGALVRTAITHVTAQAREELFAANPQIVAGVMWVSTLDSRTSPICQSLDGEVFEPKEGPRPPAHINCRSSTSPILNGQSEVFGDRASEVGPVPAKTTYQDFLRRMSAADQDDILGPTRGRLFRAGNLDVDNFVDRTGRRYTLDELRTRERDAFERAGLTD